MPTRSIKITDHQDRFIDQSVQSGQYDDASEVIRAGLRLLELHDHQEKLKLEALRCITENAFKELDEGKSTTYTEETFDQFMDNLDQKIRSEFST